MIPPYRSWAITWDYGYYTATGPDYEAWTEGEGEWVDNGWRCSERTLPELYAQIDLIEV